MVAQLEVVGEAVQGPTRLGVWLLGPTDVRLGGRPIPLRTRKTLALLAYLAAEDRMHRRAELAALLWPESDEHRARTTLRSAVHDLRGALRTDGGTHDEYLLVERDSLGLRVKGEVDLDLAVLRSAYDSARSSIGVLRPTGEERQDLVKRLTDGAAAYRGDFMDGFFLDDAPEFDYWASLEREGWRTRMAAVLDRLSGLFLASGEVQEAAAVAERWAAHEPSGEAAHERLMRTRYAMGDPTGALRGYEQYRSALGTGPPGATTASPAMAALAARIRSESGGSSRLQRPPLARRPGPAHPPAGSRSSSGVPLVGRAQEFGALAEEHSLAASGGVRVVALVGEAGIGKTRLAEEFMLWAAAEGTDVLRGDCPGPNRSLPYGSVISAIRYRLERERAPDDLLEDIWLSELGRLLPELRERYPDLEPPPADEAAAKSRLFEAVARLLGALSRRAPVIVFVDDLHWSDAATLDLLRYVIGRLAGNGSPILLLVAMREEELDRVEDLWGWMSAVERAVPLRRLELGNLDEHDTVRVLRSLTGDTGEHGGLAAGIGAFGRRLHAETGGHPFFLLETIKALLDKGTLSTIGSADGAVVGALARAEETLDGGLVPPSVRALIRERLTRVGLATADLLVAGAVLSDHFDFDLVSRVAGLPEREGLAAVDEAVRGRLLREPSRWRGDGLGGYSFVHDKIRDVVYSDAGEARRRVFHRRALAVLAEQGAAPGELARHALAARDVEATFRHCVAAAEQALSVFAVEDARGHLVRARALLDERVSGASGRLGAPDERRGLYAGLGRVHEVAGEWVEAQEAYEKLLAEAQETRDRETEWLTLHRLATLGVQGSTTQVEQDGEFLRGVRSTTNEGNIDGATSGVPALGHRTSGAFAWSPTAARRLSTEALALAREMRRDDLVAQSLAGLAVTEAYAGRWGRVLAATEEEGALHARLGDRTRERQTLSLSAHALVLTGRPREAVRRMREHPGLAGQPNGRTISRADVHSMAMALTEIGGYEEALGIAREGLAAARSMAYAPQLMLNLLALGDVLRALGHLQEARECYQEMSGVMFPPKARALVHAKLCAVAALAADWRTAYDEAVRATRLRDEVPILSTGALHLHLDVEALLRGGNRDLARDQLNRFGAAVDGNRRLRLAHLRALTVLRRFDGHGDGALEQLDTARGLAEEIGLPGELWQIAASVGALHAELGNEAEAQNSRARAAMTVGRLADGIRDPALRAGFVSATAAYREPVAALLP